MALSNINWDYTKVNLAGLLTQAIRRIPELSAKWTNLAPSEPGMAIVELCAHMTDVLKRYDDFIVQNLDHQSATLLKQMANFALLAGTSIRPKTSATALLKFDLTAGTTTPYLIPAGTQVKTDEEVIFETSEDLYIGSSETGNVLSTEGETVPDVSIGVSEGSAFQRFEVPTDALVFANDEYAIDVDITEGGIQRRWEYIDSLINAGSLERKYSIEVSENKFFIVFGDNKTGLIPQAGSAISATYRVGGGERGNVDADAINILVTEGLAVDTVTNPDRSYGGLEQESINSARNTIPASIKANDRAIATEDFKTLAERFDGVAIARSFAIAQAIYIFVVPSTAGELTQSLKTALETYFASKSQQGYVINIMQATYKVVGMTVSVKVKKGYSGKATDVLNEVKDNLTALLSPVSDPPDLQGEDGKISLFINDFGADLHIDSIYTVMRNTSGVEYGNITELLVDSVSVPIADISVDDFEIIKNGVITITVISQEGDEYTSIFDPLNQNQTL